MTTATSHARPMISAVTATAIVVADMIGVGVFTSLGFQVKDITSGFALLLCAYGVGLVSGSLLCAADADAAGLRRRRTATSSLIALVQRGSRRERVVGCRALGWIGATIAIPLIATRLDDPDWKVRMSAAKALGALRATSAAPELRLVLADRNPRVRQSALLALRRIERAAHGA